MKTEELMKRKNSLNISNEELAKMLGIDQSTLWRKLTGRTNGFTLKEANDLISILGLNRDEAVSIFFDEPLA